MNHDHVYTIPISYEFQGMRTSYDRGPAIPERMFVTRLMCVCGNVKTVEEIQMHSENKIEEDDLRNDVEVTLLWFTHTQPPAVEKNIVDCVIKLIEKYRDKQ